MSGNPGANRSEETLGSVWGLLRSLVASALVLLFLIGWAGFWIAVVRIHYLHQDWISVIVTTVLGAVPVVGVLIWSPPVDGLGAFVRDVIDVFTPSSTASTSGE